MMFEYNNNAESPIVGLSLAGKCSWDRHKVGFLVAFDS
jgi:hypothetical protein